MYFALQDSPLDPARLYQPLRRPDAGAYVGFEGWVRDHHRGRAVQMLDYEAWPELALREGQRILEEARGRFDCLDLHCVHRVGTGLVPGEIAVWVGAVAAHREAAFLAGRWVLDEVKGRVPIWKREYFTDGTVEWVGGAWRR